MPQQNFFTAKILIVDDEPANIRVLERLLKNAGYINVRSTTDSREVIPLYLGSCPDLLLLDLMMPHPDGFEIMEQLGLLIPWGTYFPILVLTADITSQAKERALASGAKDFLTKPFEHSEVLLRIRNLIEARFFHLLLQKQAKLLEDTVRERTRSLEKPILKCSYAWHAQRSSATTTPVSTRNGSAPPQRYSPDNWNCLALRWS